MKHLYFDAETIPSQDPAVRLEIAAGIKPPGTFKKAESIAEWMAANAEAEAEAEWLKTSFDGAVGQISCLSMAIDDSDPITHVVRDLSQAEERRVIGAFLSDVAEAKHCIFVGHNVIGFDLPFLWKRCMVLGIRPPVTLPRNPKAWSELVVDTMLLWDPQQRHGGSMDRLCRVLGIPGKAGVSGADVWPMAKAGRFDDIATYCADDVRRTRFMHKRMTFA